MKPIERLLYHASAYTVAISILFFAFAKIFGFDDISISFGKYLLIFAFSLVISSAEYILVAEKIKKPFRYFIHYIVLFVAFYFIFLSVRSGDGQMYFDASGLFAAFVIFTMLYFLILGAVKLISRRFFKQKSAAKNEEKKPYKSMF